MRRVIIVLVIVSFIYYILNSIEICDLEKNKYINIEIKGEVSNEGIYEIELGSKLIDALNLVNLKDDADLSGLSYLDVLYNNQIIVIPKKQELSLISINSASFDELTKLPGIGEGIALKIIEYRNSVGCFDCLEDLKQVSGIGDKKYEKLKGYICL